MTRRIGDQWRAAVALGEGLADAIEQRRGAACRVVVGVPRRGEARFGDHRFVPGGGVMDIAKGSFVQYALADKKKLALKPANLNFEQAAASTISGITALQAPT